VAPHGTPTPDVGVRTGVGAAWAEGFAEDHLFSSVFVVGSDGNLSKRGRDGPSTWQWVDHGRSTMQRIATTRSALKVSAGDENSNSYSEVPVLDADGHLWCYVTTRHGQARWLDNGLPPGRPNVDLVGSDDIFHRDDFDVGMSAVATGCADGKVQGWSSKIGWVDLGSPGGGDRAGAGVGVGNMRRWTGSRSLHGDSRANDDDVLHVVVLGRPSRRLWGAVWYPNTGASEGWQDLGAPVGVTIRASIGVMAEETRLRVVILGNDGGLWLATVPVGGASVWTSVGSPGSPVVGGRLPGTAIIQGVSTPWWPRAPGASGRSRSPNDRRASSADPVHTTERTHPCQP
jgi:hypothetical protein